MYKRIIISLILILNLFLTHTSFSYNISNQKIEKAYNNFIQKIEKKYTPQEKLNYLQKIDNILDNILKTKKLPLTKKNLINDLIYLNQQEINHTTNKINTTKTTTNKLKNLLSKKIKSEKNIIAQEKYDLEQNKKIFQKKL
jgi:hypothetical protein